MKNALVETRLLMTEQNGSVMDRKDRDGFRYEAYCVFGQTYPTSTASHIAFNGQWRESPSRSYLLGNGYRNYNPILRRFDRPDSWSPFGKGGLNAYAYCGADPVNQIDPSGHLPELIRRLGRHLGIGKKAPLHNAMTDIKQLGPGLTAFADNPGGGWRINFLAHSPSPAQGANLTSNNRLGVEGLTSLFNKGGGNFDDFDSVRLLVCYSAAGGKKSYASRLAQHLGKPVKGYRKKVFVSVAPAEIDTMIREGSEKVSSQNGKIVYNPGIEVYKQNILSTQHPEYRNFSYLPRTFNPRK